MIDARIGTVVQREAGRVRVQFPDTEIVSGWLTVLQRGPTVSVGDAEGHTHPITVSDWTPAVGAAVLCLYLPGFNADGYVIGGVA